MQQAEYCMEHTCWQAVPHSASVHLLPVAAPVPAAFATPAVLAAVALLAAGAAAVVLQSAAPVHCLE